MAVFVGVKDFSRNPSRFFEQVQRGHSFVLTSRGKVVAVLSPAREPDLPAEAYLPQAGWIDP